MPQHTQRRSGEIQRALLTKLSEHPDGLRAKEAIVATESALDLTDYEKADYPSRPGKRRFDYLVRFGSIPMVKAGWLRKAKGIWTATDTGVTALGKFPDAHDFRTASVAKYREWVAEQPSAKSDDRTETDESMIESNGSASGATLEEAEESAWSEISEYLGNMSPYDFQELVAGLLRGMGHRVSYVSPPGPDQGIDIMAHSDPLGVQGPRIKVQVKRRSDKVGFGEVHSFLSLIGEFDAGIFVALSGFSNEAERAARADQRRRIILLDGTALVELWIEHYAKIPDEQRRLLPLKPIHFLNLGV